ncbi:MLP-like protein [Mya arenaria]|uniref:MLP-like protein n=1 Tax=Mya arenaria TaxID=6604 RepID=A0ABY7G1T3_MYAAR|nr:MLP-like protein [Mya arenaria]
MERNLTGTLSMAKTQILASFRIKGFTLLSEGTKYQAVAGDWDIRIDEGTEQFSNITGVALHPRYNSADMMSFDVCVLKVETPFVFNDFVAPVKLVTNRELEQRVRRQNECYMAGFGFASLDPLILPNILQKVKAKIYPRKFCDYFPYEGRWKSNVLCAFAPPKTACFGDSGGPLLCKTAKGQHVQVGIIQFGRCGYYSGNARIYSNDFSDLDIRLAGGYSNLDGRVERKLDGIWGTVCRDKFGMNEAQVVCKMLSPDLSALQVINDTRYGPGTGPIFYNQLACSGSETSIDECSSITGEQCEQSDAAAVACSVCPSADEFYYGDFSNVSLTTEGQVYHGICSNGTDEYPFSFTCLDNGTWIPTLNNCGPLIRPLNITGIRLSGRGDPNIGRVELQVQGQWGTVCGESFDAKDATVLCRMMGLKLLEYFTNSTHGSGSGPIMFQYLHCDEYDYHIQDCNHGTPLSCSSSDIVSLVCSECGPPQEDGEVTYSTNGTIATIHCHYEYLLDDPVIECTDGIWSQTGVCDFYGPTLNISTVRLVDGDGVYKGRVEIEVNGTYGTICDSLFDLEDAEVICKTYNQSFGAAYYFTGARYGEGTGPIHIDRLFCGETNTFLYQCPYHSVGFCDHSRDVSVVCNECGQPDIAFWGVGYFTYHGSSLYADCSYYKTYVGELKMTCDHANGAWVTEGKCQEYSRPLNIQDVRLSGGQSKMEGRVEIKSMDIWGTICKDGFGMKEAHVICNMIGFPPAQAVYLNGEYSGGTGPVFVDDLLCGSSDTHINNCSYVTYDDCSHFQDVAVKCTVCDDPTPNNGSINGTQFSYGTVLEVSCDYGHYLVGDQFINCQRNATWNSRPECPLIDCGDPTPENGRSNVSKNTFNEIVEIACDEGYNIKGTSVIWCKENLQWSDSTICAIVDCGPIETEHAHVNIGNITTFGEIALVSCDIGYLPVGTTPVKCLANGTWSGIPSCDIRECGDPTPRRGQRNTTITTFGTIVLISCDDGLEIPGNPVIKCQEDGTWSESPVCDSLDCGPPSVANGHVTTFGNTTFGNNASIVCNEGYSLDGSGEILCTANGWGNVSCVLHDCGNLTIDNGKVLFNTGTQFGDSAEVQCFLGYDLNGDSRITCLDGSKWSDYPSCDIKKCPVIETSINGDIVEPYSLTFGSTVTFNCNDGYLLVGEMSINCESSGEWSTDFPICNAMKEFVLARLEFMTTGQTTVTEVCANGYVSFDKPHTNPGPPNTSGPNGSYGNGFKDVPIIAAYYAEINTHISQSISYRTIDILHDFPFNEEETRDIEMVRYLVRTFGGLPSFEPKFLLIADWNKVSPLQTTFQSSSRASFQLALVSDGLTTFFLYIYPRDLMQWTLQSERVKDVNVWVGYYNADTKITSTNPYSFTPSALQMDLFSKTRNVEGLLLKLVTKPGIWKSHDELDCIHWYNQHITIKNTYHEIMSIYLPECPCDLNLARFDPWFWRIVSKIRRFWWQSKDDFEGDVVCVDMWHRSIFDPYGKSCCYYRESRRFVEGRPLAGGLYHYHPSLSASDHAIYDVGMKQKCCKSKYCELYYQLHPIGTCYTRSPYSQGNFWGDPHISTLDRMNYTFNGLGEYTLLLTESNNTWFTLQARTERAVKHDGNLSDATIFSAFAAKDHTNASLHAELNSAKHGLILYGDGLDFTKQFLSGDEYDSSTLSISNNNGSARVFFKNTGVMLDIGVGVEMLSLSTIVPSSLANNTRGLLGNFDGDPTNDLRFPNRTILNSSSSEREIFFYGAVNERTTVFLYEDGKDHDNFHNSSYVPLFLDEIDNVTMALAIEACSGTSSTECIYDFALTLNPAIAADTVDRRKQFDQDQEEIDEVIPTVDGCNVVNVTLGGNVTCTVNVDDNIDIQILENNTYNATFDRLSSTITYTHTGDISSPLSNYNGCAGNPCTLGRNCTDLSPEEQQSQGRAYMCSECPLGYTSREGDDNVCIDIDECASYSSCEQSCINTEGSFICVCEQGLQQDRTNLSACRDFNECEDETHNCSQVCDNFYGGYRCECRTGFVLNETTGQCLQGDVNQCDPTTINCTNTAGCTVDEYNTTTYIDECLRHICPQECINFNGGFECSCLDGYRLEGISTCSVCEVPYYGHECNNTCDCTGRGAMECNTVRGCECEEGWVGSTCDDDTNECYVDPDICADVRKYCTNIVGSYTCDCINGYEKNDEDACTDVDECTDASLNDCHQQCSNNIGSYTCGCSVGYVKINGTSCQDFDECARGTATCEQICENKPGSYNCYCHFGYKLNDDRRTCTKLADPCRTLFNLTCSGYCVVKDNTSDCRCRKGFVIGQDAQTCLDVNECQTSELNGCDSTATCMNTYGSYQCECPIGARLENDGRTCTGCICESGWMGPNCDVDVDECALNAVNCTLPYTQCVNAPGSASCQCKTGYTAEGTSDECLDIDECIKISTHDCEQFCNNTDGSYECSCRHGFLQNGGSCTAENVCTDDERIRCPQNATCAVTNGNVTCTCLKGSHLINGSCDDINECQQETDACTHQCLNKYGGYVCSCDMGFQLLSDGFTCEECSGWLYGQNCDSPCLCDQDNTKTCNGTNGECSCKAGWLGSICSENLNECSPGGSNNCPYNSSCVDTPGSFKCVCNTGYLMNGYGKCQECQQGHYGNDCGWKGQICSEDLDECSETPDVCSVKDNSHCENVDGSYLCSCDAGYTAKDEICKDIKECLAEDLNHCDERAECEETDGNYTCLCPVGTHLQDDGRSCIDIDECKEGALNNCTQTCTNTAGGYNCGCYESYSYSRENNTCNDENECSDSSPCGQNCNNTAGSFFCSCDIGFKLIKGTACEVAERTTVSTAVDEVRVDLTIILEVELDPGTDLRQKPNIRINVNYSIIYRKSPQVALGVSHALVDIAAGTEIEYDGLIVAASAPESYTNDDLCGLYEKALGGCESGYECVIEGNEPMCELLSTSDNYAVVVGVAVGLSVFCIAVLIIITSVVVYTKNREARRGNIHRRRDSAASGDNQMSVWPPWKEEIVRISVYPASSHIKQDTGATPGTNSFVILFWFLFVSVLNKILIKYYYYIFENSLFILSNTGNF